MQGKRWDISPRRDTEAELDVMVLTAKGVSPRACGGASIATAAAQDRRVLAFVIREARIAAMWFRKQNSAG